MVDVIIVSMHFTSHINLLQKKLFPEKLLSQSTIWIKMKILPYYLKPTFHVAGTTMTQNVTKWLV